MCTTKLVVFLSLTNYQFLNHLIYSGVNFIRNICLQFASLVIDSDKEYHNGIIFVILQVRYDMSVCAVKIGIFLTPVICRYVTPHFFIGIIA